MFLCKCCKIEKDQSEFGFRNRKTRKGFYKKYRNIYCNKCEKEKSKLWRKKNPDKVKNQNNSERAKLSKKQWLFNNIEIVKKYRKLYYNKNIEKFKEISKTKRFKEVKKIYKKNKRKNDYLFRIRENISNAILKALKKGKSNKAGQSILKYLSYNINDLKNHLELQFDEKMTWDNYGKYWHIDHIIPQSDLPYSSMEDINFKICWELKNLRPLEASQNSSDGATKIRHKNSLNMNNNIYHQVI